MSHKSLAQVVTKDKYQIHAKFKIKTPTKVI